MNREIRDMITYHIGRIRRLVNGTLEYNQRVEFLDKLAEVEQELKKID